MSLGFAAAAWVPPDPPIVMVAADSRFSFDRNTFTDAGIKTYELGGRAAMVAAGHALPALTAAEIVRPIVDGHNRSNRDRRLGFYDITRLLAFFLKRSVEQQVGASSQVVIAGFLSSGVPALAHVVASPDRNRVVFVSIEPNGKTLIPAGVPSASCLLIQRIETAQPRENLFLVVD